MPGCGGWARPAAEARENTGLGERIARISHPNRQVDGSPRLHAVLRARSAKRAGGSEWPGASRKLGLSAKARKHRTRTTDSQHEQPVAPNLLNREFTASAPNTRWVADITAIWMMEGWLAPFSRARHFLATGASAGPWMPIATKHWSTRPLAWRWRGGNLSRA